MSLLRTGSTGHCGRLPDTILRYIDEVVAFEGGTPASIFCSWHADWSNDGATGTFLNLFASLEGKLRLRLNCFAVHFDNGINHEVDWRVQRRRIDDQVAALREFKTVRRMMPEIIIGELGRFVRFADVDRHPFAIGVKFCPAVVACDFALVRFRGNRKTNREARGNAN